MKIYKKILLLIAFILFGFCCYFQYIKLKYDKVYEQRTSPQKYEVLYSSGALNLFREFVYTNIDTISSYTKIYDYRKTIDFSDLEKCTKDTIALKAIEEINDKGFYRVIIEQNKKDDKLKIYFKKRLLQYKITPSYHCIIFTEKRGYEYKFNEDDYWYFFAYDDNEHDLHNFLDFRPEWALPYFEAFEFFKRNPDYALNK